MEGRECPQPWKPGISRRLKRRAKRLIESECPGELKPQDIYDFYYLNTLYALDKAMFRSDYASFVLSETLPRLKRKYVLIFKQLLAEQLRKYVSRGRVDPDFDASLIDEKGPASVLRDLMAKTFRSDMKRRNDVWDLIADYTSRLEVTDDVSQEFILINMLNNAVHNTQTLAIEKFPNGHELTRAYDTVARAKSIKAYERFVQKDLRELGKGY